MATNTLPNFFQVPSEGAIASYDFQDIVSGAGYITLYAGDFAGGKGLVDSIFKSSAIATVGSYTGTLQTNQKVVDQDFDVLLNRPIVLKGEAYVQFTFMVDHSNAIDTCNGWLILKLRKWDGSTETEIASVDSSGEPTTFTTDTSNPNHVVGWAAGKMTVSETLIKKGEYIRLTIEGWVKKNQGNNTTATIAAYIDPAGTTTGYGDGGEDYTTDTFFGSSPLIPTLNLPVRIDL